MSRKTKLTANVIDQVYSLKRECYSNIEICRSLGISESTFYDWLDANSPRFNSEFSESYFKGVKESRTHLKDLAVSALAQSLRGAKSEQVWYDSKGKVTKSMTKTQLPNMNLALSILQSLDHDNFSKDLDEKLPEVVPPVIVDEQLLNQFYEKFNSMY